MAGIAQDKEMITELRTFIQLLKSANVHGDKLGKKTINMPYSPTSRDIIDAAVNVEKAINKAELALRQLTK